MPTDAGPSEQRHGLEQELAPFPPFMRPFVDAVARMRATVHTKLLAGFLVIALLLLTMGVVCIVVLERIDGQVVKLTALSKQVDQAQQMIYQVTAQSHYRAMALLSNERLDREYTARIAGAKQAFDADLADMQTYAIAPTDDFFVQLASANEIYRAASDDVTDLDRAGRKEEALRVHIDEEHPRSHVLEDQLNALIDESHSLFAAETASFARDRRFLTGVVAAISVISLLAALGLGGVLSWSLIRPVRRVDGALEQIAGGDFATRVEVPNRDEFGNLANNVNIAAGRLAGAYHDLEDLNVNLQETVDAKVSELERMSRLKRYLSPQLAESIVEHVGDLDLGSRRKYLTTFFSDVRGFTEAAERMEPDELIAQLNDYLSAMTEIVFKHEGTLDKYVGDALMVFFGDPIWQDDHAARAVRMAFEMRDRLLEMREEWGRIHRESFQIGIGITTGWVTVGDIGTDSRSDYTVLGNEVNVASRLSDSAAAGQILVTDATLEALRGVMDVQATPVERLELKGVSRDVRVFEVNPRVVVTA
jgi:class 3 adenylate cyclase/CHASE3 domain sensor protein